MLCLKSCLSVDLIDQSWLCLVQLNSIINKVHRFGELITTGTNRCSHRLSWYWIAIFCFNNFFLCFVFTQVVFVLWQVLISELI